LLATLFVFLGALSALLIPNPPRRTGAAAPVPAQAHDYA
jgi:hypothetical protein